MLCLFPDRRSKRILPPQVEFLETRTLLSPAPVGGATAPAPSNEPPPPGNQGNGNPTLEVRQNADSLTKDQVSAFVNAILKLKATYVNGSSLSVYDQFVQEHYDAFSAGQAHGGPAFLAWHREFLLQFEQELQTVDPTVTIPYWDFTVDNTPQAPVWSKDFLGGDGDPNNNWVVETGPFRQGQWVLNVDGNDGQDLRRQFGYLVPTLPTADDVQALLGVSTYDVFPFDVGSPIDQSFRNNIEGFNHPTGEPELHNRVHGWIGGSMAIAYSPNDPVFWLVHANIDRLWAEWENTYGDNYAPDEGAPYGQNLNDPMSPFGVTPASVLDHWALGYRYDTEPDYGNGGYSGGYSGYEDPTQQATRRNAGLVQAIFHGLHGDALGISTASGILNGGNGPSGGDGSEGGMGAGSETAGASPGASFGDYAVVHAGTGGAERPFTCT